MKTSLSREQPWLGKPQLVRLTQEQEREVVMLLTELLLDAAARKRRGCSPGVFGGVIGGASGSVVPFPERRGNAREVA